MLGGVLSAANQSFFGATQLLFDTLTTGYNIFNNERNVKNAQRQQDLENERYLNDRDYQRALQERVFEREDTAIQRAALDAEKAGFSPLTVAGNGAASGALVGSTYQSPASGQASVSPVSPIQVLGLMRGLQEMQLAYDANERADKQVDAQIAFQSASLEQNAEKLGMDFMLRNAELFNQYQLASEDLKLRGKQFEWQKDSAEKRLIFDINKMQSENNRFAAEFARQGVWREEDIRRYEDQFKWQKGEDVTDNLMNLGNLLVNILGVLNGGNRR